jgi:hypothetical protein
MELAMDSNDWQRWQRETVLLTEKTMPCIARKIFGSLFGAGFVLCVAVTIFMQFSGVVHVPQPTSFDNVRMAVVCALLLGGMVFSFKKVD